jgi:hypothetical protein
MTWMGVDKLAGTYLFKDKPLGSYMVHPLYGSPKYPHLGWVEHKWKGSLKIKC